MEALQYGWAKFRQNPAGILVPGLIVLLIVIAIEVVVQLVLAATILGTHDCTVEAFGVSVDAECGPGFFARQFGAAIGAGIGTFLSTIFFAGLVKSALEIVDGREPLNVGGVLGYVGRSSVITTALFLAALSAVGTFLFWIPGIIVSFLTAFTVFFVVDRDLAGIDAIKASAQFVIAHIGDTILFFLLGIVAIVVGALACLVGLFVAVPVVFLGAAYTYRVLQGQPVSPTA